VLRFEDGVEKRLPSTAVNTCSTPRSARIFARSSVPLGKLLDLRGAGDRGRAADGFGTCLLADPAEVKQGKRLLCSAYALADSVIRFDYPSDLLDELGPALFIAKVEDAELVSDTVARWPSAPLADRFSFQSGQYIGSTCPATDHGVRTRWRRCPAISQNSSSWSGSSRRCDVRISHRALRTGRRARGRRGARAFILRESGAPHIFVAGAAAWRR